MSNNMFQLFHILKEKKAQGNPKCDDMEVWKDTKKYIYIDFFKNSL